MPQRYSDPLVVNAGKLRHQVQIQQQTTTQDGLGGQIEVWTTIRTTRAAINYATLSTKEASQSGQFSAQVTHIITIRGSGNQGITIAPGMRVVFGSHTYLVQLINNIGLQSRVLNLQCLEINGAQ